MNDYAEGTPDTAEQSGGFIGSLPVILWQRRWFVVVPAVLFALAGLAAAFLLPRTYRSSAVMLVESQDLPGGTTGAPDDNPIDRRIAKIRQQILSRPDLVGLIQTYDLYNASSHAEPLSKLVDEMRGATAIAAVDADVQAAPRGNKASIAFSLSFDYSRPAQAQLVAQTFVDRLMKLETTSTREQAENSVNFLQDQEQSLQTQLSDVEGQINRITGVNGAALSSANIGMIGAGSGVDYSSQIANLQRENATLASQSTSTAIERDPNVVAAENQLAAAKATYSDDHPDVKLAERRLATARASAQTFQQNGVSALVKQQIAANNLAISRLSQQQNLEQGRAASLVAAQARGPAVVQQVTQLQAKADGIRANLAKVSANLLTARSMSKLVDEQRGERLTLIEPPVTPDRPSSPNRPLLIAGGVVGGLAAGVMLALLIELLLRPIRSVAQLSNVMGGPPLAVVPTLTNKGPKVRGRGLRRWWRRRSAALLM